MTIHARLSPSSAERWIQCPGSVALVEQAVAEGKSGDRNTTYAEEGTSAHTRAEIEVSRRFGLLPEGVLEIREKIWREEAEAAGYDTAEMIDHAIAYADWVQDRAEELGNDAVVFTEQRVYPAGVPASDGTADVIVVSPKNRTIQVVDYKYGRGVPVSAMQNPQLRLYGLGAIDTIAALLADVDLVCITVFQPRLESISTECILTTELYAWRDQIAIPAARLALGLDEGAYLAPSEAACRWCPVAGECKARMEFVTKRDFGNPNLLTNDALGEILGELDDIEAWCKAVRELATHRVYSESEPIPGWKAVRSGGRRKIEDTEAAVEVLEKAGYSRQNVTRETLITLTDLQRLLKGRKVFDRVLGHLVTVGDGKISLVPEDDPREGVDAATEAASDFNTETKEN